MKDCQTWILEGIYAKSSMHGRKSLQLVPKEQIIGLLGTTCYRFQLHLQFEGKGQGQLLKQIKELESLEDSPSVITSMILASWERLVLGVIIRTLWLFGPCDKEIEPCDGKSELDRTISLHESVCVAPTSLQIRVRCWVIYLEERKVTARLGNSKISGQAYKLHGRTSLVQCNTRLGA